MTDDSTLEKADAVDDDVKEALEHETHDGPGFDHNDDSLNLDELLVQEDD